jgi:hypothetical protein
LDPAGSGLRDKFALPDRPMPTLRPQLEALNALTFSDAD